MGELLMTPGPVMLSSRVIRALSRQACSHVSQEFAEALSETRDMLKEVFRTSHDVVIAPGSSSLGLEMAIANSVRPGDKVIVVSSGYFSDRIAEVVRRHRGIPVLVGGDPRKGVSVEAVEEVRDKHPDAVALCVVHVETSTGVVNPVERVGRLAREEGLLYIVDAVSSVGGMDVKTDEWGIDYCVAGPQKALAAPPGLALLSVSQEALNMANSRPEDPFTFYMDVRGWVRAMRDPFKRYVTHAVHLVFALKEALSVVLEEGLERRFERHRLLAEVVRRGVRALGLKLFPEEGHEADTLTAIEMPEGISSRVVAELMLERGVRVAPGWGEYAERVLRIGHMGNIGAEHVLRTLSCLESALSELGFEAEGAVEEASSYLSGFDQEILKPPDEIPC